MNPTRRLLLAVLKYPAPYSAFNPENHRLKPPKCFFDTEAEIVNWLLSSPFSESEVNAFTSERDAGGKPSHRSLDCSLMECADDIAYAVHDLEDIVGRRLVEKSVVLAQVGQVFAEYGASIGVGEKSVTEQDFSNLLFFDSTVVKRSLENW